MRRFLLNLGTAVAIVSIILIVGMVVYKHVTDQAVAFMAVYGER